MAPLEITEEDKTFILEGGDYLRLRENVYAQNDLFGGEVVDLRKRSVVTTHTLLQDGQIILDLGDESIIVRGI